MSTRSAVILSSGLVIAALIVAAAIMYRPVPPAPEEGGPRYQFYRSNGVNVFILDTRTGRVWQKFMSSNSGPSDWRATDLDRDR